MSRWAARAADKLLAPPAPDSDGESDGSDRVPVPSFQNSFSQAIEKALLQLDSEAASVPPPVLEPGLPSRSRRLSASSDRLTRFFFSSFCLSDEKGGKKKKKKQKILFSTSMVHTK